jgi:hypothetical protein
MGSKAAASAAVLSRTAMPLLAQETRVGAESARANPSRTGVRMMSEGNLVITGVQENGKKFRPSDWVERLSSTLASFHSDNRLRYSSGVQPCMIEGEYCLVVARWLKASDPAAYDYVMGFAQANQLRIQMDRRANKRAL